MKSLKEESTYLIERTLYSAAHRRRLDVLAMAGYRYKFDTTKFGEVATIAVSTAKRP